MKHRKRRSRKSINRLLNCVIIILVAACGFLAWNFVYRQPATDAERLSAAQKCYAKGDYKAAIRYAAPITDNPDAYLLSGDCYTQMGSLKAAAEFYRAAEKLTSAEGCTLGEWRKAIKLNTGSSDTVIRIDPTARGTRNMTITFFSGSGNLAPSERYSGRILNAGDTLHGDSRYRTTGWFSIDPVSESLYLTGNFNCAIWQFRDSEGNITLSECKGDYLPLNSVKTSALSFSAVDIPDDTVAARVTYWDESIKNAAIDNDEIFIGTGKMPTGYTGISSAVYAVPDLKEGQYILCEHGRWMLWDGQAMTELDWDAPVIEADTVCRLDGDLCGRVTITAEEVAGSQEDPRGKEYGIRFDTESGIPTGERLGAARGFTFDCSIAGQWTAGGRNDFDAAYPWSDIRRCCIQYSDCGTPTILYEGEAGYASDGSSGNVMVQIPKFYVKRTVSDGKQEIWVSGSAYEGYSIEPVFIGDDGSELDYVYIGAYLGSECDGRIVSVSGAFPTLMQSYPEVLSMAQSNGQGFCEASYLLYSAIQKLFLVEVGTMDSSFVFAGDTSQAFFYETKDAAMSFQAAEDARNTNTIALYDNTNTRKLIPGTYIALFRDWDDYSNSDTVRREVMSAERNDGKLYITFDGAPADINAGETAVTGIPARTGQTDALQYHTGTVYANDGRHSFSYRCIENLYGGAMVMLDESAYLLDGAFIYETRDGETHTLCAEIADQSVTLSNYDTVNTDCCIRSMTYDAGNPLIMLPSAVGNGASVHNFYGDYWWVYNLYGYGKRYLMYGGMGDNMKAAGLFQLRAWRTKDYETHGCYSARIMYIG